jgi:large subunit ribosomal protein L24
MLKKVKVRENTKMHVKKGDTVLILSGDDNGKKGKVLEVSPKEGKVIIEGRAMVKKHVKPRKMGDPGGIISAESAIYASKVQVVCPSCSKPTRIGSKRITDDDGRTRSHRICRRCGETI